MHRTDFNNKLIACHITIIPRFIIYDSVLGQDNPSFAFLMELCQLDQLGNNCGG